MSSSREIFDILIKKLMEM